MPSAQRLTALALARAMLAGPPRADGLAARMRACLDASAAWQAPLAERIARLPGEHWRRLSVRSLATLIENDPGYRQGWQGADRPVVRRHILRVQQRQNRPPLGLDRCALPRWPHPGALADALSISNEGLWRLTLPSAWQRRQPLARQHYRFECRAKRLGGWRLLEVPLDHLLGLQRQVLAELLNMVPPHEAACGFVRSRSLLDHAGAHAGQAVLLKFDLQDFFGSVHAGRVHAIFSTLGYGDGVARALTALCTTATPEPVLQRLREAGALDWQQAQRLRAAHLPQGAPTSPALANLCAFRLDLRLDGLASTLGARYTRYADDIVISGPASLAAARHRIEAWVGRIACEEGFRINHRKTRCQAATTRQSVCGVVVNQKPNLARDEFDRLKALLHRCATRGPHSQNTAALPHWKQHLLGRVAWVAQLNPAKARRLQRWLDRIDWSSEG